MIDRADQSTVGFANATNEPTPFRTHSLRFLAGVLSASQDITNCTGEASFEEGPGGTNETRLGDVIFFELFARISGSPSKNARPSPRCLGFWNFV
jgi:hypothetical protein